MKRKVVQAIGFLALATCALAFSFNTTATKATVVAPVAQDQLTGEYDEIYTDGTTLQASGLRACPRDIQCPDVYNPVTCSNGVTYPNSCYAYRACATGCGGAGS